MDARIKKIADEILTPASLEVVELYTEYALMLNAFDVTRKEYESRSDITLSTTHGIPGHLRISVEMDVQLAKDELVDEYKNNLPESFCRGFLVALVSRMDAWMEDIFEAALPILRPTLSDQDIEKCVRSAWADSGGMPAIRRSFLVEMGLIGPTGRITTPAMMFDRYEEMREARHAIMHSNGKLTAKHVSKLSILHARFPTNAPKGAIPASKALLPKGVCIGSEVVIGPSELLGMRKWAFDAIGYLIDSFRGS
jgi:hypothetical protein